MRRVLLGAALIGALSGLALVGPSPAEAQGSPDGTAELMTAMGRVTFRVYCASCHGRTALGDGSVAQYLTVAPADLTQIRLRNGGDFPKDQIAATIDGRTKVKGHGTRDMPVWGDVFRERSPRTGQVRIEGEAAPVEDPEERAQRKIQEVVLYLESIQAD